MFRRLSRRCPKKKRKGIGKNIGIVPEVELGENERLDDLQLKGLKIIQRVDWFCFGIDSVILADFAGVRKGDKVADLGTGSGIIPILLAGKTEASLITGVEIQQPVSELARRNVILNGLEDRITICNCDMKDCWKHIGQGIFDSVTCNPPYIKQNGGILNPSDIKAVSRHELLCRLEDVINAASELLRFGGLFSVVYKPSRLVDLLSLLREYKLEPKFMRFVHSSPDSDPSLVLVKSRKGGGSELKVMKPLYICNEAGM